MYPSLRPCFRIMQSPRRAGFHALCVLLAAACVVLSGCSSRRFLPEGRHTLSEVRLKTDKAGVKPSAYRSYVRQNANAKWFNLVKVPLGIYCMSSADSVRAKRRFQRALRKMGEAPVVYDPLQTLASKENIRQALSNNGYLHAEVDTAVSYKGHKARVTYQLRPGPRYYVDGIRRFFDSEEIERELDADSAGTFLRRGVPLDVDALASERDRIVRLLHEKGYYGVRNDFVTFTADTLPGELGVDLTLRMALPAGADSLRAYSRQRYRRVSLMEEVGPDTIGADSTHYRGLTIFFKGKLRERRRLYSAHVGISPGDLYSERAVQNTYGSLNALPPVALTNVRLRPVEGEPGLMDCDIYLRRNKPNSIGAELEGTNTAGDLGAAASVTYSNRNLFRGAVLLTLKARGAYEAITGLEGYGNRHYLEWSGEASLRFPSLLLPFVNLSRRQRLKAASEVQLLFDSQSRPEFVRRVLTGAWAYRWNRIDNPRLQHRYDLLSVNYIYMPWVSDTFRRNYLEGDDPHYAVLRYTYDNLFILKTGYSFVYNSLHGDGTGTQGLYQKNGYQIKGAIEAAGNVLYAFSRIGHCQRYENNAYHFLGTAYSQYVKLDLDFAKSTLLNERNSVAFHVALGIGIPYGNSTILPFEKRYFAGGANSVRGWSVRDLGPGSYKGSDGRTDFINQTGNLKLDLSVEWRTYLFWKLHGAFFIDAGNVWNTRKYADMDGAQFSFARFYKEIAVAYGLGLRLNFDYFILRLDGGMKAVDPSVPSGRLHYPLTSPRFSRDFTLHFAVGLPF